MFLKNIYNAVCHIKSPRVLGVADPCSRASILIKFKLHNLLNQFGYNLFFRKLVLINLAKNFIQFGIVHLQTFSVIYL